MLTAACYSFDEVTRSLGLVAKTMVYSAENASASANQALKVAEIARKKGVLGLQDDIGLTRHNPFFCRAIEMVIDGTTDEDVVQLLSQEVHAMQERHGKSTAVLRKAAEISPAMGLIGTIIGLVQMLGQLDDPSKIGPAMAVALLTTLYGALLSYMVLSPLATKLERNTKHETLIMRIYLKASESIARKENPRRLELALNTLLPSASRVKYFS
jgi:chemotaxis protein MotA